MQEFIQKLNSRKFISMLVAIINGIIVMATVGYSPGTLTEVITVTVACISYMLVEGGVDKANAASSTTAITGELSQAEAKKLVQ